MKCGGKPKRRKAGLGADGALMAAATITAAGMNVAATSLAAKQQADAAIKNAQTQAKSIEEQTKNNTQLQKDSIAFQTEQKQQDRDLMNDINMTMQMMAGRQNSNDILNANRMEAKYGGKGSIKNKKRNKLRAVHPSYGGTSGLVETTDGGIAVPLYIDENGYGVYELRGDSHEQYHKVQGGKYKSGVGVRTRTGEVVEGEGSKTNRPGELYVKDYYGDYFLSKHNIDGFNPTEAVLSGVDPREAYYIQELNKQRLGLTDDGSKAKLGKRCTLRNGGRVKARIGYPDYGSGIFSNPLGYKSNWNYGLPPIDNPSINTTANPIPPDTLPIKAPTYSVPSGNGGNDFWGNYGGAIVGAGANLVGAGLNWLGNYFAGKQIAKANQKAADILTNAYKGLNTIDMSIIDDNNSWDAPQVLAAVRDPNVSVKPLLERVNRDARYENNIIKRSTISSAARQQRLSAVDDRRQQRISEIAADANNRREAILQKNVEALNNIAAQNADRTIKWRSDKTNARLQLAMYNNNINNLKITGPAQAQADAALAAAQARGAATTAGWSGLGSALTSSAAGFASTWNGLRTERNNWNNVLVGADLENQVAASISRNDSIGINSAINLYNSLRNNTDSDSIKYTQILRNYLKSKNVLV